MTGILRRMETRNLIKRETKNGNRRSLYVSMTEYGKEMAENVEDTFSFVDQRVVKGMSQKEINEFMRLLEIANNNLIDLLEE